MNRVILRGLRDEGKNKFQWVEIMGGRLQITWGKPS